MNDPFWFIIVCLAVWRVTSLLSREDGPFHVFLWLRHKAGVRYDEGSKPYPINEVARGLLCFWCTSLWVALFLTVCYFISPQLTVGLSVPFAISGLVILADEFLVRGGENG